MSPHELKLLTIENGDKYILRGTTRIAATGVDKASGGSYVVDPSFAKAPPGFLDNAKASWLKVRAHSAEDEKEAGAKAKAPPKPCTMLAWKGDGDAAAADVTAPLTGKLYAAEGGDWSGKTEPYFVIALDALVCDATGASVEEIQVIAPDVDLKKWTGKRVSVTGLATPSATIHDHRPLVLSNAKPKTVALP